MLSHAGLPVRNSLQPTAVRLLRLQYMKRRTPKSRLPFTARKWPRLPFTSHKAWPFTPRKPGRLPFTPRRITLPPGRPKPGNAHACYRLRLQLP